jgi:hypothetical protein
MQHLPMDYPDYQTEWSPAEITRLRAAVLKEAITDVTDTRLQCREEVWKWIAGRKKSSFMFSICAEAFSSACTDEAYQKYSVQLLLAAVTSFDQEMASRRTVAHIWRWVNNDEEYPFSFRACCSACNRNADVTREKIWKKVSVSLQRKGIAARAA